MGPTAGGGGGSLRGRRVVFVLTWSSFGGAERKALTLARHLRDAEGAEPVCVALTAEAGAAAAVADELGIPWHVVPADWRGGRGDKARQLARVARRLRSLRPDVLLPQCTFASTVCGLTWRATGARLCVWNQCDVIGSRVGTGLVRRALASSSLAVACAHHGRELLVRELGAAPERTHTVYGEVRLPRPVEDRAAWRSRLGLGDADLAVTMLANFKPGKDHPTLLRAWRRVVDGRPEGAPRAVLVLAGSDLGTLRDAKAVAFDLDLGGTVRFPGRVADVAGLLAATDVAALASESECLGRGVLEPMAVGLPVTGTDNPGIREAVGPDGAGLLAPPGDAGALAGRLLRLLDDGDLRGRAGAANASRIAAAFSRERTTDAYVRLLEDALA
ncbi:MAG: glycosyltransferase family 4 protein, partial [Pseudomonadota bacterium]